MVFTRFNLSFWNIQNLGDKFDDEEFLDCISCNDFVGLTETKSKLEDNLNIPSGFSYFHAPTAKGKKGLQCHGVLFLYKSKYRKFMSVIKSPLKNVIISKIHKELLGLEKDVCVVTAYIPPMNSISYDKLDDPMTKLDNFISKLKRRYHVIIGVILMQGLEF
jgi:hypothetical protein